MSRHCATRYSAILVSLSLSAAVIGVRFTGHLWPALPVAIAISAIGLVVGAYRYGPSPAWLGGACALLVMHTGFLLLYPPTLTGIDPDTYAMWTTQIIQSGNISVIGVNTYTQLPIYLTFVAITSHVTSLPASTAFIGVSLALSVIVPFVASRFTAFLTATKPTAWPSIMAASGMTIATMTVWAGYHPIPMGFGALLLFISATMAIRYIYVRTSAVLAVLVVCGGTIALTHNFVLVPLISILFSLTMIRYVREWHGIRQTSLPTIILFLAIAVLALQWLYVTNFGVSAVYISGRTIGLLPSSSEDAASWSVSAAQPVIGGVTGILARRIHAIILIPLAAISWLFVFCSAQGEKSIATLSAVAAVSVFLPVSVFFPDALRYTRTIIIAEVFLIPTIIAGGWYLLQRMRHHSSHVHRSVTVGMVGILLIIVLAQVSSAPISPDHPAGSRGYLTTGEATAKEWGLSHGTGNISADPFYAHERPNPSRYVSGTGQIRSDLMSRYQSIYEPYLNRSLATTCPPSVLYRDIRVYRASGAWVLNWNPQQVLDIQYNRVYDNGIGWQYRSRCSS